MPVAPIPIPTPTPTPSFFHLHIRIQSRFYFRLSTLSSLLIYAAQQHQQQEQHEQLPGPERIYILVKYTPPTVRIHMHFLLSILIEFGVKVKFIPRY